MILLSMVALALADEGMWLPEQLPAMADELARAGLELPAAQLADTAQAPLAAIVGLGFCSASFLSPDGLVGTNHHCTAGYLQYVSDAEHNRARDGFVAGSRAEEAWAGPAARLWVVESIVDVTPAITRAARRARSDAERHDAVDRAAKALVAACEARPDHRCEVAAYHGGREHRLISKLEIKDVRLVAVPPASVGSYGGEIDNWMWPRHAADFALLRAYVGPDGHSADHAPENVPYRPPHWLTVDPTGAQPGEFVMVAGYPGGTYRYRTARQLRFVAEVGVPAELAMYEEMLAILHEEEGRDEVSAERLALPIDVVANVVKYLQGIQDCFRGAGVVARKQAEWDGLLAWVAADAARQAKYGPALGELDAIQAQVEAEFPVELFAGSLPDAVDLLGVAHAGYRWSVEREKRKDIDRDMGFQDRDRERLVDRFDELDQGLHISSERRLLGLLLSRLAALPPEVQPAPVVEWVRAQGGLDAALDRLFTAPSLADAGARRALLDEPRRGLEASSDPWLQLAVALERWQAPRREREEARVGALLRLEPLLMEALQAWRVGRVYPDANGTLRVTTGHVEGYRPRDGVSYLPQTTVGGMVAKAGDWPFDAPDWLLRAAAASAASRWVDPQLGDVPVDFLTTLDTTGGNSGSATLNGKGELVGFVFDGNYESMSADWFFDPALTRSIHVDVRYVLFVLEAMGAGWVLEELGAGAVPATRGAR